MVHPTYNFRAAQQFDNVWPRVHTHVVQLREYKLVYSVKVARIHLMRTVSSISKPMTPRCKLASAFSFSVGVVREQKSQQQFSLAA